MTDEQRKAERDRLELDDAERDRQRSFAQLRAAEKSGQRSAHVEATELERNEDEHLQFALPDAKETDIVDEPKKRPLDFEEDEPEAKDMEPKQPKKLSKLEEIALRAKERQELSNKRAKPEPVAPPPPDAWLAKDLIVKGFLVVLVVRLFHIFFFLVMNKKLENGAYYKKKGIVFEVHNGGSVGDIEMLDSKDALRLASTVLETVLPQPGGRVMVVQGAHRHRVGELLKLNIEQFSADVKVGDQILTLPYESVCKIKSEQSN